MRALLALLAALPGVACSTPLPPDCVGEAPARSAWLVDQGWHTEIGLPAEQISGPLAVFRSIFPGAKFVMFGFGKRTWITAKVETPSELLMGPFPGPGAIQVIGLRLSPDQAFHGGAVERIDLQPDQSARLQRFVWNAISKTNTGEPRLISPGLFAGSLFYAATHGYDTSYTCNSWTAEALQAAGLPVRSDGVMFAAGVLDQSAKLAFACTMGSASPRR